MVVKLLFELNSQPTGHVPCAKEGTLEKAAIPAGLARESLPLPNLNEVDVVRHFTALSRQNYGVDNGFYPLGSCTMKYNPKVNEDMARLSGFASLHPLSPEKCCQGALEILHSLENYLCEITGFSAFSLQPAAGAHGELACCMIAKKHFGAKRTQVILPDSSHGTNPASAAMCGFEVVEIKSDGAGGMDLGALRAALSDKTALVMITNPSTLGLFDQNIGKIAQMVHEAGALLYCDGANLNAMLGITRPADQGFDMMHINLHKTFSTPHGGGGPGGGPIGVTRELEKYLPVPRIVKSNGTYSLDYAKPDSIGKVKAFWGNFGVALRAYTYIRSQGPDLRSVSESAVLCANYLMHILKDYYDLPYNRTCCHEFVLSASRQMENGVHAMDIAKRLLDYGYHAPTIYFPLIVKEALMIEPNETESKATLDEFAQVMIQIAQESKTNAKVLHDAPINTPVGRVDGVLAARKPNLRWAEK
ncbi:glycine dehydrogenase subunit 2 [Candidatus Parvarchaeota archaeon]|nr:glycine dehydrogenase subunit 2 [Candidatus Parvarchaeota archaeon]